MRKIRVFWIASAALLMQSCPVSSLSGQIVYFDNIEVSAIPEPATIIIIALGVPLLHGRRVKNKHA
jgi:hypothetical protein